MSISCVVGGFNGGKGRWCFKPGVQLVVVFLLDVVFLFVVVICEDVGCCDGGRDDGGRCDGHDIHGG